MSVALPTYATNAAGVAKETLAGRLKKNAERVSDEGRDRGVSGSEEEGRGGGDREALARKAGAEGGGKGESAADGEAPELHSSGVEARSEEEGKPELGKSASEHGDQPAREIQSDSDRGSIRI